MICNNCGNNYDDNNNFCPHCGAPNTGQNGYNQNNYNQNNYNQNGYNQNGYSQNGYNQNGYNYSQSNQGNNNFGSPQQNWNNTYGGGYGVNIQKRDILVSVLLSIITCGIYGIFWYINIVDDLNYASGHRDEPSGAIVFVYGLITCGIYKFYWMYKAGDKVNEIKMRNGMPADGSNGILYLLCCFLGGGIVAYCLIQSELNRVAR